MSSPLSPARKAITATAAAAAFPLPLLRSRVSGMKCFPRSLQLNQVELKVAVDLLHGWRFFENIS